MLLEEGWQMYMYVIGTVTSGESSINIKQYEYVLKSGQPIHQPLFDPVTSSSSFTAVSAEGTHNFCIIDPSINLVLVTHPANDFTAITPMHNFIGKERGKV